MQANLLGAAALVWQPNSYCQMCVHHHTSSVLHMSPSCMLLRKTVDTTHNIAWDSLGQIGTVWRISWILWILLILPASSIPFRFIVSKIPFGRLWAWTGTGMGSGRRFFIFRLTSSKKYGTPQWNCTTIPKLSQTVPNCPTKILFQKSSWRTSATSSYLTAHWKA